jgi:hypothetical protein
MVRGAEETLQAATTYQQESLIHLRAEVSMSSVVPVRIALALLVLSAQEVVGRADASVDLRHPMTAGQHLRVTSPNGNITVQASDDGDATIHVEKRMARGRGPEDIAFMVVRSADGLAVCAVHDDADTCDLEHGHRATRRGERYEWNNTRATFTVRVPTGVRVSLSSGNGDLMLTGVQGPVAAYSGNGDVTLNDTRGVVSASTGNGEIIVQGATGSVDAATGNGDVRVSTTSGPVNARTGNGHVAVSMSTIAARAPMSFASGNGNITLAVPTSLGADIDISTGSGSIRSELPLTVRGALSEHRLQGTVGGGGVPVRLHTGSGNVIITRAP